MLHENWLVRHTFPAAKYILLEDHDIQARVRSDPRVFLESATRIKWIA